jgi:hypothetical protein
VLFGEVRSPQNSYGGELQHLFRSRYFNLTSGAGYVDILGKFDTFTGLDLPPPPRGPGPRVIQSTVDANIQRFNVYTYGYINLLENMTFTAGASFDSVTGGSGVVPGGSTDQFNPKFGITWNLFPSTTVRAAVFRVFRRTTINDQTIEPTQVAGFNQFFDDNSATDAWRYGAAIDQKITRDLFGGVEFSTRDLTRPIIDLSNPARPITQEVDTDEYLARACLFWTPHPWLALRAQYIFERFTNDPARFDRFKELDTHRVPLGINFFHPSGLSASLTGTYWNQDGEFVRILG